MEAKIRVSNGKRILKSDNYNFVFDMKTGFFARWGKTPEEDPTWSPFGPEILDIEVTTICDNNCKFCYKGNTRIGKNMSFETFKTILDKMPKTLTQTALGIDAKATSNPDLFKMLHYARENNVIPNLTAANLSDEVADKLSKVLGACAISRYSNKNICYDSVRKLTDRGMDQVNIHIMVSEETFQQVQETLEDRLTDPRLEKLNAIVMLSLKQKGRGAEFHPLDEKQFKTLVDYALEHQIGVGLDSCSAHKFLRSIEGHKDYVKFETMVEPCEGTTFSSYCNVKGEFFPCSFTEGTRGWETGLDIVNCKDFIKDIWNNERTVQWRNNLLGRSRNCPIYRI